MTTTNPITEDVVYSALKDVIDPEIGINIVDLGLVYGLEILEDGHINVVMTLTTPGCPLHATFAQEIERSVLHSCPTASEVSVELVWDPPWHPMMISPEARDMLGFI